MIDERNTTLGKVVRKVNDKVHPKDNPNYKFIGMDCIRPHTLSPEFFYDFNEFKSSGNRFQKGQVLYGRMRPYLNKVYKADFEGACSGEFIVLECQDALCPDYLKYVLHSKSFVDFSVSKTSGDRPRISFEQLADYPVFVPSIEEQQQIVFKLEELFSELDKSIEGLKLAQNQLKLYRQSVLQWAFEGKLTNENVKDGELPQGWVSAKLESVAKFINGDRGKNYPNREEYVSNGIAFINTGHIEPNGKLSLASMNFISEEKFNMLNSGKIQKGDLVYCLRGATLGKTAFVDQFEKGAIASSLVIVRPSERVFNKYLFHYLKSPFGRKLIKSHDNGSAQPNLSAKSLSQYQMPFPSLEDQVRVVAEIESRFSVSDRLEENIEETLMQAEALQQSILKRAFKGKL